MRIALCHDQLIPPRDYGGTERVIDWLGRALIRLGHEVTLIAREGSALAGARVIATRPGASWDELAPADVELLHLWATPAPAPAPAPKRPFVVTIEGNGRPGERFHPCSIFVSRKHAENHGGIHYVYNGLPIDEFACDERRDDSLVFLAKASWSVKNLPGAIDVARRAGLRLEVLGSRNWPLGIQRLLPPIRGVHYRGMVGDREKRALLRRARGLVFPVRWHEPFGIAVTEALASGCPVFATPYGSLPEIVTPQVGRLAASAAELATAIAESLAPATCRTRVESGGFTDTAMAKRYLDYYASVLATGRLSADAPTTLATRPGFVAQELLPWT